MLGVLATFLFVPATAFAQTSSDPRYFEQQPLYDQIHAPAAWEKTIGSRAVVVAVIDTGFDTLHEDLQANTWTNTGEIPDNGIDDDRNGYTDDVHGWNFVENNNNTQTPVTPTGGTGDAVNHGSLVAGLIGAAGNNGLDGTGLNWQVSLMPLRAISNSGSGTTGAVINAINYAINNGAQVINMSFVGDINDTALKQSFYRAYQNGIVVVAAAGNDRGSGKGDLDKYPEYPACFDHGDTANWVLGVSSVNASNQLSRFGDFGSCVDLVAPGENIFSTVRYAPEVGYVSTFRGGFNGTSFSAPLVSGAAALIKSIRPDFTAPQIITTLLSTADPVDADNPDFVGKLGYGLLNVGRAVQLAEAVTPAAVAAPSAVVVPEPTPITPIIVPNPIVVPETPVPARKFFYLSKKQLFSLDLASGKKIYLGTVPSTVIDFTSSFDAASGRTTLGVLAKSGSKFTVTLYDERGVASETFDVAKNILAANKNLTFQSLRLLLAPDGLQRAALLGFDSRKKETYVIVQNLDETMSAQTVRLSGSALRFDASMNGQTIVVAQLLSKKLTLTQIDTATLAKSVWSLGSVASISDLRVGPISGGHDQAAISITKDGKNFRSIVDIPSKSYWSDTLGALKKGEMWKILLTDSDSNGVLEALYWKSTGGTFAATDNRGNTLKSIALPSLGAIIY